jgi:hypothetical protein
MITFNNPQKLDIYDTFILNFAEKLEAYHNSDSILIQGINTDHPSAEWILSDDDPFATGTIIKPLTIAMNQFICHSLCLTEKERHAMILHEIGHLIDATPRESNQMVREINADKFAVEFGYGEHLKSGLQKLVDHKNYKYLAEKIGKRIQKITDYYEEAEDNSNDSTA